MKIMVVDDSRLVRERIVALVKDIPAVEIIVEADDAETAVGAADYVSPDVVILDLHLGSMSGIDALPLLKRAPRPPVVIVLTNDAASPRYERKCRELGADFFFDKSSQFQRVVQVIESIDLKSRTGEPSDDGRGPAE